MSPALILGFVTFYIEYLGELSSHLGPRFRIRFSLDEGVRLAMNMTRSMPRGCFLVKGSRQGLPAYLQLPIPTKPSTCFERSRPPAPNDEAVVGDAAGLLALLERLDRQHGCRALDTDAQEQRESPACSPRAESLTLSTESTLVFGR